MQSPSKQLLSALLVGADFIFVWVAGSSVWCTHETSAFSFRTDKRLSAFEPFGLEEDTNTGVSWDIHCDEYDWETERFRG